MEEDQVPGRKYSSLRRSTRLQTARSSSSSIAPLQRGGKGETEEGQARGAQGGEVSPSPAPVATPPQYRMDRSIVQAARDNNLPLVMSLHHEGISLDSVDRAGFTVLIIASLYGYESIVDYANQCNVNYQDNGGWTALHYAVFCGHVSIARKLLVTGGADDTLTNWRGETALQVAIRQNKPALVSAWESFKREATAARVERARKDLEDRMVLALHCSTVAADGDESPSTLLSEFCRQYPEMMLPVMYAFMGDSLLKEQMDGNYK